MHQSKPVRCVMLLHLMERVLSNAVANRLQAGIDPLAITKVLETYCLDDDIATWYEAASPPRKKNHQVGNSTVYILNV